MREGKESGWTVREGKEGEEGGAREQEGKRAQYANYCSVCVTPTGLK